MTEEVRTIHTALTYENRKDAEIFFKKILGLKLTKSFILSEELTNKIFGVNKEITVDVYSNKYSYFEIFISNKKQKQVFDHIGIKIKNKKNFINRCKKYGLKPYLVKKGEKKLLFVKDFSDNIFEVTE